MNIEDLRDLAAVMVVISAICAAWICVTEVRKAANVGHNKLQLDYARKWWRK